MDLFNVFRKKTVSASSDKSDKLSSMEDPLPTIKILNRGVDEGDPKGVTIRINSGDENKDGSRLQSLLNSSLDKRCEDIKKVSSNDSARGSIIYSNNSAASEVDGSIVLKKTVEGGASGGIIWKDQGSDPLPTQLEVDSKTTDSIVFSVIEKFLQRSELGMKKYGTNLDRTDLNVLDWIQHTQEELMDAILYLEKLKTTTTRMTNITPTNECVHNQEPQSNKISKNYNIMSL